MSADRRPLRPYINAHCRGCIYDPGAAGTWRQQVTLCPSLQCELFPVRPTTKSPIPESVMDYYSVPEEERPRYRAKRPQIGRFKDAKALGKGSPRG